MTLQPYIISGIAYEADGSTPLSNEVVWVVNTTTKESIKTTTNDSGQYIIDLANLPSGYSVGDGISARATKLLARYVISDLAMNDENFWRFTIDVQFEDQTTGNALITTVGLNEMRDWIGNVAAIAPIQTAWGTGTTALSAGDTTLEGEQERNAFATNNRSGREVTYSAVLAGGEANGQDLTKTGVFNASSGGDLFFERINAKISKTSTFTVTNEDKLIVV